MGSFRTTFGGTLGIIAALVFAALLCCGGFTWMAQRGREQREQPVRVIDQNTRPAPAAVPVVDELPTEPEEPEPVPDPQRIPLGNEAKAASKLSGAKSLLGSGKKDAGRRWLKEVVEQYPGTEAAHEANRLLSPSGK
jgi:hypothetical protein